MKVLHVGKYYPPRWGGMETAVKDLCEAVAADVEVTAVVASGRRAGIREQVANVPVIRVSTWATVFSQPLTPGLFARLRAAEADVIHLHEPNPLAMVSFLLSGCRAPLVVHYHADIVRQKRLLRLYRPWLNWGLSKASAIVAASRELVENSPVLQRWRDKCVVIPLGIDLEPFLSMPAEREARDRVRIAAVGRLCYYKGFQYLIDAMREVDAECVIAGEGELRSELQARIRRHGLESRVRLAGRLSAPELLALYRDSDIFCLPSCEPAEAFGLVMVEAMAAGLPVVSTDLPTGVRSVNLDRRTGIVVPPHDSPALATALSELAASKTLRRDYAVSGRARARAEFSREVMGRRMIELYSRVCR